MGGPIISEEPRLLPRHLDQERELKCPPERATLDVLPSISLLVASPEQGIYWELSCERLRGSIRKRSRPDKNLLWAGGLAWSTLDRPALDDFVQKQFLLCTLRSDE
jgi:hypothetical protein